MQEMFYNCSKLTELDLSSWNTSRVTNMTNMFRGCSKLKTIYASDLFVAPATSGTMFTSDSVLE
jgi:surface protein